MGKLQRPIALLLLLVIGPYLSGCAAMFSGTSDTIFIRSEEPGTRFLANERDLGTGTSTVVQLSKKDLGDTVLRAQKAGCDERVSPISTSFDPITLLGLFVDFGLISILVVDWLATGAVTKASQDQYVLTPVCATAPSQ